jgi:hypothetical protein
VRPSMAMVAVGEGEMTMTESVRGGSYATGRENRTSTGMSLSDLRPSQWVALVTSVVFVAVGVAGFIATGFDDFAAHDTGEKVLIFEVNPVHNLVHLVLGLVGLALVWRLRGALTFGLLVAIGYGAAFVYGLFAIGNDWDFLSLNWEDNWLHLGLAAVGLAIAGLAVRDLRADDDARDPSGPARRGNERNVG